jgi:thioredoxin reductase (NADPH)
LFFSQFADRIRIVEFMPELKASALLQEVRNDPRFIVHTSTQATEFRKGRRGKLGAVLATDRASGKPLAFTPAAAYVFIGFDPNTAFLRESLELDRWGFVSTDLELSTSIPGVFAASDVRAGSTKQLGAAIGEGITVLLHVRAYLHEIGDVAEHVAD